MRAHAIFRANHRGHLTKHGKASYIPLVAMTFILGTTRTTMKKPIITQTFDPSNLDAGDPAIVKVWNLAVKEQNAAALANQDVLIVHAYAVPSRFMRKFICRLRLSEVSRQ